MQTHYLIKQNVPCHIIYTLNIIFIQLYVRYLEVLKSIYSQKKVKTRHYYLFKRFSIYLCQDSIPESETISSLLYFSMLKEKAFKL